MKTNAPLYKQATADLRELEPFIGNSQRTCLRDLLRGEEGEYFATLIRELRDRIRTMPVTYEQDGLGDNAVVHLHYFKGGCDWHITEKDKGDPDEPGQHQAFGLANLGYGAELGYISLVELTSLDIEIDLHWKPCTVGEILNHKPVAPANIIPFTQPDPIAEAWDILNSLR